MMNVKFSSGNIDGKCVNLNIQFILINMIVRIRYKNITELKMHNHCYKYVGIFCYYLGFIWWSIICDITDYWINLGEMATLQ